MSAIRWPRELSIFHGKSARDEIDQLLWDGLLHSCETGYRPLFLELHVPRQVVIDAPVA